MHAVIESFKKRQSAIYTPDQWAKLIRMAKVTRKPYVVKEMSQNDFYSFVDRKLKISKVKEVHFSAKVSQEMNFKYNYSDNAKTINLENRRLSNTKRDLHPIYSGLLPIEAKN
ncbi:hypothetical protein RN001_013934 [Aquatica leii]|uniref:Uncharacterized protein n=1 Tax=Aquatica leii TaxID=1421715 RepID=A0AAN7SE79_9COLE|nr:hypothetical protein RN001_013934 [Aquatica leii]